jgi:hypothetical protein
MDNNLNRAILDSCIDIIKTHGPQETTMLCKIMEAQYGLYTKDDTNVGNESRFQLPEVAVEHVLKQSALVKQNDEGKWKLKELGKND